jgi:hypothetical protein
VPPTSISKVKILLSLYHFATGATVLAVVVAIAVLFLHDRWIEHREAQAISDRETYIAEQMAAYREKSTGNVEVSQASPDATCMALIHRDPDANASALCQATTDVLQESMRRSGVGSTVYRDCGGIKVEFFHSRYRRHTGDGPLHT